MTNLYLAVEIGWWTRLSLCVKEELGTQMSLVVLVFILWLQTRLFWSSEGSSRTRISLGVRVFRIGDEESYR